jgi:hypothetical protein
MGIRVVLMEALYVCCACIVSVFGTGDGRPDLMEREGVSEVTGVAAPPLVNSFVDSIQSELSSDPLHATRWLVVMQSFIYHVLHSATQRTVEACYAIDSSAGGPAASSSTCVVRVVMSDWS